MEQQECYKDIVTSILNAVDENKIKAFTSELTLQECLVKPFRDNNIFLENSYISLLKNRSSFFIQPITKEILIESSKLKAKTKLKTPDTIHLATANFLDCDIFITNDSDIKTDIIEVLYLSKLI